MSRVKSSELTARDETILEMAAQGYSQRKIASTLGISAPRVNQIIREAREAIDPDAARARLGEILDMMMEDTVKLAHGPGKRIVSPSGRPVYEMDPGSLNKRGDHDFDFSKPLYDEYARLEAHKQLNEQVKSYARIFGLEQKPREKDDSGALSDIMSYMEHLELQNREMSAKLEQLQGEVIEGEIVS